MNLRTPGATKILGALGLACTAGAGWLLVLGPTTTALAEVHEQIEASRSQNRVLAAQLLRLQEQAANLEDTRETAEALATKFPATADQPGLFKQITDAATDAGIGPKHVTALTPTPPAVGPMDAGEGVQPTAPTNNLARQTVTVSVEGDFAATQELLEHLEQIPRAYLITSVTLGGGASAGRYSTTITGDMFVMPPAPEPDLPDAP